MAGTRHHSKKHGSVREGEGHHRRGLCYEYWGRDACQGADSQTIRRNVRRRATRDIREQLRDESDHRA